jgi:uridine kinase
MVHAKLPTLQHPIIEFTKNLAKLDITIQNNNIIIVVGMVGLERPHWWNNFTIKYMVIFTSQFS